MREETTLSPFVAILNLLLSVMWLGIGVYCLGAFVAVLATDWAPSAEFIASGLLLLFADYAFRQE